MELMTFSRSIKRNNQDAVACGDNFIAVADGATPLSGGEKAHRETARFSHALVSSLRNARVSPATLLNDVSQSIDSARMSFDLDDITSTLTVATWNSRDLSIATIGDSSALIETHDGLVEIVDPNYASHDEKYLAKVLKSVSDGYTHEDAYTLIKKDLELSRRLRNSRNGSWIVSSRTRGDLITPHFCVETFPISSVRKCAVMSDGLSAWFHTFNLLRSSDVLELQTSSLHQCWLNAVALQRDDVSRAVYPRLSDLDDASLARVSF